MTEFFQPASLGTTMGILLRSLRSSSQKTIADHVFPERAEFEAGLLPLQRQVIEVMIHHMMPRGKGNTQPSIQEAGARVASQLIEHWVHCTVYPVLQKNILKQIVNLYNEFYLIVKTKKDRRTEKWKKEKADPYVDRISNNLFDISTQDKDFSMKQESFYGAKMSEIEWDFLEDQRLKQKMY